MGENKVREFHALRLLLGEQPFDQHYVQLELQPSFPEQELVTHLKE